MKITLLAKNLKKGLGIVEKITGRVSTLPILNNVLIEVKSNFIKLSTTDLELGIQWWGLCKTEREGKITVPAKFFSQLINSLNDEKINIEEKNKTVSIESDAYNAKVKGISAEDFPIIPVFSKDIFIEINSKKLRDGLAEVIDFTSLSQVRPEISGVFFFFTDKDLKLVTTDSFRLAEKTVKFSSEKKEDYKNLFKKEISFILPQKTAKELISILSETEKNTKIYLSESQIMFETSLKETDHPEVNLVSRLIEGEYPAYQEIIPKESKTKITAKKEDFVKQLKVASLFGGKINEIKIKTAPEKKSFEILSQDSDLGENRSVISAKVEGDKDEVSFNWKFLLEGLNHIKSSEVVFGLQDNKGPAILRPVGDASYLYVVMPINPD
ncbi:MAG: DNA polymerase III subunit beta [Candidatus Paceibacterota bacterium]|jgi:DNA polymerase-3 subunit beta|nr:DNA polymerase III subunit beta [Candidatus Paceibacterota bacterium]